MQNPPLPKLVKVSTAWSDKELFSAVEGYLGMLRNELAGVRYVKAEVIRQLRNNFLSGRTTKSIEFRMQNISAVLYNLKMPRISGYLPARNVGTGVSEKIIAALGLNGIAEFDAFIPTADPIALANKVSALRRRELAMPPNGSLAPEVLTTIVKAWILMTSNGICEGCDLPAQFVGQDGLPYLEVHHIMPLSSHGSDRITNAVALCPICHRRCHYSLDRDEFRLCLYQKIDRLRLEVPEPAATDEFVDFD
jgi:5-methylcytosine-specific restriction protein A